MAPEEKAEAKIIDLMEALRQSVADHGGAGKEAKRGRQGRPAKRVSGKRASEKRPGGESESDGDEGVEGKVAAASAGRGEG